MKYKIIDLRRSSIDSKVYFIEKSLQYDREDSGEYIFAGCAYIYEQSNAVEWKRKLVTHHREKVTKEIDKFSQVLHSLDTIL